MAKRKTKPRPLVVDGNPYFYWVRGLPYDDSDAVPLGIVIRADFGTRSFCAIKGLTNRERWHDYPDWNETVAISITPKMVCDLIRRAHAEGWTPSEKRANFNLDVGNLFDLKPSADKTPDQRFKAFIFVVEGCGR